MDKIDKWNRLGKILDLLVSFGFGLLDHFYLWMNECFVSIFILFHFCAIFIFTSFMMIDDVPILPMAIYCYYFLCKKRKEKKKDKREQYCMFVCIQMGTLSVFLCNVMATWVDFCVTIRMRTKLTSEKRWKSSIVWHSNN